MSIRPLSKELQAIARDELNEDPKRIESDIQHMREWLQKQPHIKGRTDDQWLITWLRGCKYSLERTKEKLDLYYTVKTIVPEFYKNRNPFAKEIQEILKAGIILPLNKYATPDSPRVYIMRHGKFNPSKSTLLDVFKTNIMITDIILNEDDQALVSGVIALLDLEDMGLSHAASVSPAIIKKGMLCLQEYPNRPKGIHFINTPGVFETIWSMVKPFLKEKILGRVVVHKTSKLDTLHQVIPKSILPKEYGGDNGTIQELIDFWKKKVEDHAEWFKAEEEFGTDESKRPGKPKTSGEMFGIEGSFRKLDVD